MWSTWASSRAKARAEWGLKYVVGGAPLGGEYRPPEWG
jgi:hypothetical protein